MSTEKNGAVKSMTGFGEAKVSFGAGTFLINASSTNHRFLDIQLRLPDELSGLEPRIRHRIKKKASRGRIFLIITRGGKSEVKMDINVEAARNYLSQFKKLADSLGIKEQSMDIQTLINLPGVLSGEDPASNPEKVWSHIKGGIDRAMDKLSDMRIREGEALKKDMLKSSSVIKKKSDIIRRRSKFLTGRKTSELRKKAKKAGINSDSEKSAYEISGIIGRMDVNEELIRLASHTGQFEEALSAGAPCGTRLDFILQEMLREINAVASKGQDSTMLKKVIDIKTQLQRMREQAHNIE